MEIADSADHRALRYVAAVTDEGYQLTRKELQEYLKTPPRVGGIMQQYAGLQASISLMVGLGGRPESQIDRLARVRWMEINQDVVEISDLGRAVLRALDKDELRGEPPAEVILDPKDPFSYARVIGRIARHGNALIADPYFRLDQLLDIVQRTEVTRVLTSTKISKAERAALATAVQSLNLPRSFEIRVADGKEMHDRYFIPAKGPVEFLGTSLNQVGQKFTVVAPIDDPAATVIRKSFEDLWSKSAVVA